MDALGIDYKLLLAQVVNFILFLWIFKKFIAKPFARFMADEEKREKEKEKAVNEAQLLEKKMGEKEKEIMTQAQTKATTLLNEAKKSAETLKKEMMESAKKEVTAMKKKTEEQLKEERQEMYDEVQKHIVETSTAMVEKALKNFIKPEAQQQMVAEVVKHIKS